MRISDWSSDVCSSDLGIEINRIEAESDALIERIKSEGANSPADIFITVDAGRLWRAAEAGLFQPVESELLNKAIPESPRYPDGRWFGFPTRETGGASRREPGCQDVQIPVVALSV